MNIDAYFCRQKIIQQTRTFFSSVGFIECTLPILHASVPTEPHIYPFTTTWSTILGHKQLYLSTSPEADLKKLLSASSYETLYSIHPAFRTLEQTSPIHTPEFLMLECYKKHATYKEIMDLTEQYISSLFKENTSKHATKHAFEWRHGTISLHAPWKRVRMDELFANYCQHSLHEFIQGDTLYQYSTKKGYATTGASWEQLFYQVFLNEIEPYLGLNPLFITHYPARISPLCRPDETQPEVAERFELYVGGIEIANGNTEAVNAGAIREIFEAESTYRRSVQLPYSSIDEQFLQSIRSLSYAHTAGVGIGIDRLSMILANVEDLSSFAVR